MPYRIGWGTSGDLQISVALPPPGPQRKSGFALLLRVSRTPDMQNEIYRESTPVTSNTDTAVFHIPADRVPRDTPFYWQVYWVDQPRDAPTWALTGAVETRVLPADRGLATFAPNDDDEVPADLLHFVLTPGEGFPSGQRAFGIRLSTHPQFATIDYAWWVPVQNGNAVDFRPSGVLLTQGVWYAGAFAVVQTETAAILSEMVVHRFTAIPPCSAWNQSAYGVRIVDADLQCTETSRYTNPNEALGPPNAQQFGPDDFAGIVSLGIDGSITVELGRCAHDRAGMDIRVYQVVANEGVEVQVSQFKKGPWISLGWQFCGTLSSFIGFCEFDLTAAGITPVRFIRVIDRQRYTHFGSTHCGDWNVNPATPGADIDAVQALH